MSQIVQTKTATKTKVAVGALLGVGIGFAAAAGMLSVNNARKGNVEVPKVVQEAPVEKMAKKKNHGFDQAELIEAVNSGEKSAEGALDESMELAAARFEASYDLWGGIAGVDNGCNALESRYDEDEKVYATEMSIEGIDGGAYPRGNGSKTRPYNTLAQVEADLNSNTAIQGVFLDGHFQGQDLSLSRMLTDELDICGSGVETTSINSDSNGISFYTGLSEETAAEKRLSVRGMTINANAYGIGVKTGADRHISQFLAYDLAINAGKTGIGYWDFTDEDEGETRDEYVYTIKDVAIALVDPIDGDAAWGITMSGWSYPVSGRDEVKIEDVVIDAGGIGSGMNLQTDIADITDSQLRNGSADGSSTLISAHSRDETEMYLTMSNVDVEGGDAEYGVYLRGLRSATMRELDIDGVEYGLRILDTGRPDEANGYWIGSSTISGSELVDGVQLDDAGGHLVINYDTIITDFTRSAASISEGDVSINNATLTGADSVYGVFAENGNHVYMKETTVSGYATAAVHSDGDVRVEQSRLQGDGIAEYGVYVKGDVDKTKVHNNFISGHSIAGTYVNRALGSCSRFVGTASASAEIRYNTFVDNALALQVGRACVTDADVQNNIVTSQDSTHVAFDTTSVSNNLVSDYNLFYNVIPAVDASGASITLSDWQNTNGYDTNSVEADPQFVSATDYHIQAGSPAENAGFPVTITPFAYYDIDDTARSETDPTDIGADEI